MPGRPPPVEPGVGAYLDAVGHHLAGPARTRRAILDELRDGLHEAIAAHRRSGSTPEQAVIAALDEFGPAAALAAGYADELATARARRTTSAYLASGPVVGVCWLPLLTTPDTWRHGAAAVSAAIPVLPMITTAAVIGAVVLLLTGRVAHHLHLPDQLALHGTITIIAAAAAGDLLMLTTVAGTLDAAPPVLLAITASTLRLGLSAPAIAHCLRSQRAHQTALRST